MVATNVFLIHFLCYWLMVFLYDTDVPDKTFYKSVLLSLKNQVIYTYPTINILFRYYPISYDNFLLSFGYLPILVVTGDIYFYISHRPLHTKWLFHFHKSHHTGKIHVAKSLDADGIEHVFGNLGSFISGILLLQYFGYIINIYILSLWVGIATLNTCLSHSNYNCELDNGVHYLHHKNLRCNYGTGLYLIDRLTGSYKEE